MRPSNWLIVSVTLVSTVYLATAVSISSYFTSDDQAQLKSVLLAARPYKDAVSAYWSLRGLSILNSLPKDSKAVCDSLKSLAADTAESVFCLTEAAALVNCQVTKTPAQETLLKNAVTENKVSSIYYAYTAMKNLKLPVDAKEANAALEKALNTEESPTSMAYAFLLASALKMDVDKRYQLIEDVYAQADIVDNKYMQFDGGIYTTALVVEGSYKLASVAKKVPITKPDQVLQLTNYLLSRKHVNKIRSAVQLLVALQTLSSNEFHVPVAISLESSVPVSSSNTKVKLRVSNVLGGSLGKMALTADSGRHIADEAVILSKKQLAALPKEESAFELDFADVKAPFGFYRIQLTAAPAKPNPKLIGLKGSVELKVVTSATLHSVKVGVADSDQSTTASSTEVAHPKKLEKKLEADFHQKLVMTFYVKSSAPEKTLTPHQVFVRLTHKETGQEIVFVATADDNTKQYKFELDVGPKSKEFGRLSGLYEMVLVVGDAIIDNPIEWHVADVELTFSGNAASSDMDSQYKPKPEIQHMFREPEKRPAAVVSNVFTVLCLIPFLLMIALWMKLGANISNFPASVAAVGFHLGLAAIFGLYYCYWTQLNMFETIKYLTVIGLPTFLFGNQLLSSIANNRKAK